MLDTLVFCTKRLLSCVNTAANVLYVTSLWGSGEEAKFFISVEGKEQKTLDERIERQKTMNAINFPLFFLLLHFLLRLVEN